MEPPPELIFLIGYRGSGKTTVARLLGQQLGWPWFDADVVLEERYQRPIRQIFAEEGEAAFRAKEAAILTELITLRRYIVATGGGVVLRPDNRQQLRRVGLVVWLTAAPAILWQRLQQDPTTAGRRPNLTQGGLAEVEELLRRREPLYAECAHLTIDTQQWGPEEAATRIAEHWRKLSLPSKPDTREM